MTLNIKGIALTKQPYFEVVPFVKCKTNTAENIIK